MRCTTTQPPAIHGGILAFRIVDSPEGTWANVLCGLLFCYPAQRRRIKKRTPTQITLKNINRRKRRHLSYLPFSQRGTGTPQNPGFLSSSPDGRTRFARDPARFPVPCFLRPSPPMHGSGFRAGDASASPPRVLHVASPLPSFTVPTPWSAPHWTDTLLTRRLRSSCGPP
jgi:hypothetical protein